MNLERFGKLFDLSGKIAVVTGASRGLGLAIANALYDAGATVVASDILNMTSSDCELYQEISDRRFLDVTKEDEVHHFMDAVVADYARIDILINNAGTIYKDYIWDLDIERYKHVLDVNLNGAVMCTKYVLPYMKRQQFGRILNLASSQAFLSMETYTSYAASKAALSHLTRIWGDELVNDNIFVNALCPCYAKTGMMVKAQKIMAEKLGTDESGGRRYYEELVPMKRILETEEVGNWAVALCSEMGNATTGCNFAITCGQVKL